jgi:hypothetical protein
MQDPAQKPLEGHQPQNDTITEIFARQTDGLHILQWKLGAIDLGSEFFNSKTIKNPDGFHVSDTMTETRLE